MVTPNHRVCTIDAQADHKHGVQSIFLKSVKDGGSYGLRVSARDRQKAIKRVAGFPFFKIYESNYESQSFVDATISCFVNYERVRFAAH